MVSPRLGQIICALCLLMATGCVTRERDDVLAAREAHARCVEAHSQTHLECQALQEKVHAAERRYDENARSRWGCDPAGPDCPTKR